MRRACLVAPLLAILSARSAAEDAPPPTRTWFGTLVNLDLRAEAPSDRFVADAARFAKLWKAWKPADLVPDVDFSRRIILVETHGSRKIDRFTLGLDQGNLSVKVEFSAHKDFPGFTFGMAEVDRAGIRSVGGKPLAK